jgi:indole-3-glycerol phosphate synthase
MSFLDEIVAYKRSQLEKKTMPLEELREQASGRNTVPELFKDALRKQRISLIAEIKMASPSAGDISKYSVEKLAGIYHKNGADAVSVLTEDRYFKGSIEDMEKVKSIFKGPVLMKDFIISEYQIYEGAARGADCILLISSILTGNLIKKYINICTGLGISALVEVHTEEELGKCLGIEGLEIIGVNARNLRNFSINPEIVNDLIKKIPAEIIKVAESGIDSPARVRELREAGYDAVLVGEAVAGSDDPAKKIKELKGDVH